MRYVVQGQFRAALPAPEQVLGATKWCVFKRINPSRAVVQAAVLERMERMGTNRIDLLQARNFSHSLSIYSGPHVILVSLAGLLGQGLHYRPRFPFRPQD
jgi:aryl-alcohol dehydrogenase-like predicted oxidoreductase